MMKKNFYYKNQMIMLFIIALILLPVLLFAGDPVLDDGVPEGYMIIEGDMIVPVDFYKNLEKQAWVENKWWPDGRVPFEFDSNVVSWQRDSMLAAMTVWESVSVVNFFTRTDEFDYVHIQASTTVNNSMIGMQGGEQIINIASWNRRITIAHELMHCLGFYHEQSRPARDQFVTIQWDSIIEEKKHNFDKHEDAGEWGYYDFASIMHYGECDFSICKCTTDAPCCCRNSSEGRTIVVKSEYAEFQSVIGNRDSVSYLDALTMKFIYPRERNWKFCSKDADGLFPSGDFLDPYTSFTDGYAKSDSADVLWIIAPGHYSANGEYSKAMIWKAPLGGVIISN